MNMSCSCTAWFSQMGQFLMSLKALHRPPKYLGFLEVVLFSEPAGKQKVVHKGLKQLDMVANGCT